MKRKIFAALLAVMMVITIVPVSVMADSADTLSALQAAIDSGETEITLTKALKITADATLEAETPVTIDARGVEDAFTVTGGTLTLGKNITVESDTSILWVNGGKIIVDGAVLNTNTEVYNYSAVAVWAGELEVLSGEINQEGSNNVTIAVKDNPGEAAAYIKGGKVTSKNSSTIAAVSGGYVEISGGEIATFIEEPTFCAVYANSNGKINMTGGTVYAEAGDALIADANGTVNLSGGTVGSGDPENHGILSHNPGAVFNVYGGNTVINGKTTVEDGGAQLNLYNSAVIEASTEEELRTLINSTANSSTIKLTDDITLKAPIVIKNAAVAIVSDVPVTIDATNVTDAFTVEEGGNLALTDNITVVSNTSLLWVNGGKIIVDGAVLNTVTDEEHSYAAVYVQNGVLDVMSGEINQSGTDDVTICVEGENSVANISGGKITSADSSAVYAKASGIVNISGGEIATTIEDPAFCAVYANSNGKINMTGGTIVSNGNALVADSNGTIKMSGGTAVSNNPKEYGIKAHNTDSLFEVSGGTVTGKIQQLGDNGATMTITGGTFTDDPTEFVTVTDELVVTENADGTWTVGAPAPAETEFENPIPFLFSVKVETSEGGKTNTSAKFYIARGASRTIKLIPEEGFEVAEVRINNVPAEVENNTVSIRGARRNYLVEVTFAEIETAIEEAVIED